MKKVILILVASTLVGCANMPTPPDQITPAHNSGLVYQHLDCNQLSTEFNSLSRRESNLVVAQNQRIDDSEVQAFWNGYGKGDGIEAAELASVRGAQESIRTTMVVKRCPSPD